MILHQNSSTMNGTLLKTIALCLTVTALECYSLSANQATCSSCDEVDCCECCNCFLKQMTTQQPTTETTSMSTSHTTSHTTLATDHGSESNVSADATTSAYISTSAPTTWPATTTQEHFICHTTAKTCYAGSARWENMTTTWTSKTSCSHSPVGVIVGSVVGGFAVIALAILIVVLLCRRKKNPSLSRAPTMPDPRHDPYNMYNEQNAQPGMHVEQQKPENGHNFNSNRSSKSTDEDEEYVNVPPSTSSGNSNLNSPSSSRIITTSTETLQPRRKRPKELPPQAVDDTPPPVRTSPHVAPPTARHQNQTPKNKLNYENEAVINEHKRRKDNETGMKPSHSYVNMPVVGKHWDSFPPIQLALGNRSSESTDEDEEYVPPGTSSGNTERKYVNVDDALNETRKHTTEQTQYGNVQDLQHTEGELYMPMQGQFNPASPKIKPSHPPTFRAACGETRNHSPLIAGQPSRKAASPPKVLPKPHTPNAACRQHQNRESPPELLYENHT